MAGWSHRESGLQRGQDVRAARRARGTRAFTANDERNVRPACVPSVVRPSLFEKRARLCMHVADYTENTDAQLAHTSPGNRLIDHRFGLGEIGTESYRLVRFAPGCQKRQQQLCRL